MDGPSVSYEAVMSSDEDVELRLFELAQAAEVIYPVHGGSITIKQDPSNTATGGCIWETSYLLAQWVQRELAQRLARSRAGKAPPPRCLETGAGCGLLGVSLAHAGARVLLTEVEASMANLSANVAANAPPAAPHGGECSTVRLGWTDTMDRATVAAGGPYDFIVGTDVVFRSALVEPLLRTLWSCSAGDATTCWICGQVRCPDAHAVLVRLVPAFFARVVWREWGGFSFAEQTESFLLELREPRGEAELEAALAEHGATRSSAAPSAAGARREAEGGGGEGRKMASTAEEKAEKRHSRSKKEERRQKSKKPKRLKT